MTTSRRLAAIVATDVVGYSRLMGVDEEGTRAAMRKLRDELWGPKVDQFGGRIVKTMGDGQLLEFPSVVEALKCAVDIQESMADRNKDVPDEKRIMLRVGVNLGDVIVEDDDIHGDGVNVAARLEGLSDPGGVCISGPVYDQVKNKVELEFADLGPREVKNIAEPVRVYSVAVRSQTPAATLQLPEKPSIAVLPFENMSGDVEQEYFADGIAEDIITALSRFQWFFVIARNSSFSYKGTSPDIRQVARELGVRYVLEGSVRRGGNRVRITGQLIEAETGHHVWAESYDRDLQDLFAVQDEITGAITAAVAPEFISAEARRIERKPPENFDAWDCAIRGNWHLWNFSKTNIVEAIRLFHSAIDMDPNSCMALSGLGAALRIQAINGWSEDSRNTIAEALRFAQRAIAADHHDAWGHAVLGFVSTLARQNDNAIRGAARALELNPNLAFAEGVLALTYGFMGDHKKAIAHHDRAKRLSPRDQATAWWDLGRVWASFAVGDLVDALEWATRISEAMPEFPPGWRFTASINAHLGRLEQAGAAVSRLLEIMPNDNLQFVRSIVPAANAEAFDRFIDGLRKAGLPE